MAVIKLYPSTISTVLAWTNPDNAKADDGVYATTGGTRNSNHDIIGSGFDLSSIPSGSVINSVSLEVQYKLSTTASAATLSLIAVKNGSLDNGTAITTTTEPTTDTIWQNTGTGSYTLETLAQLGVLFRVRRSSNTACTYSVDYLAIEVDYTAPTYDFSGSFTISEGDIVSTVGKKYKSMSLGTVSYGDIVLLISGKSKNSESLSDTYGDLLSFNGKKIGIAVLSDTYGDISLTSGKKDTSIIFTNSDGFIISIGGAKKTSSFPILDSLGLLYNINGNKVLISNLLISHGINESLYGFKLGKSSFLIQYGDIIEITSDTQYSKILMRLDSDLNLRILDEIIETDHNSLNSDGVLYVVEIIEEDGFYIDINEKFHINSIIEEGI